MKQIKLVCLLAMFLLPAALIAQESTSEYKPFDFSVQLKNNHLWRGLEITPEVTLGMDMNVKDKSETFKLGIWGGAGINGNFKEFDYYASASKFGFTLAVWDIYNFSPGATYNNKEVFNYEAHETGHFVDVSLAYRFPESFPLGISWATVVFGRDRGALNEKNLYSTYVSMDYPVIRNSDKVDVTLGIAGAFALSPEDGTNAHFYGKDPGIVNVNVTFSKVLSLGSYKVPVALMAMWNPEANYANVSLMINLF